MMPELSTEAKEAVVTYLAQSTPDATDYNEDGWQDYAVTAWQFGCMALVALGVAEERQWGAARLTEPGNDLPTPRWDDIASVVLTLLSQRREIQYRRPDGSVFVPPQNPEQFSIKVVGAPAPEVPKPNISAAHGAGPTHVTEDGMTVLKALGLVANGSWTTDAELVLWRENPRSWSLAFEDDPRFSEGLARCVMTMPQEVVEEMADLTEISAEDVTVAVERQEQANAELIERYPAQAKFDRTVTREGEFRSLKFTAGYRMDDLFFAGWRLLDGWLSDAERNRALPLFHDPLARKMREAAMAEMGLTFPQEMPQ